MAMYDVTLSHRRLPSIAPTTSTFGQLLCQHAFSRGDVADSHEGEWGPEESISPMHLHLQPQHFSLT